MGLGVGGKVFLYPKAVTYALKIGQHAEGVDAMGQRTGWRLSERKATNIGLLYPKVYVIILGDIPVDVLPNQNIGGMCPRRLRRG